MLKKVLVSFIPLIYSPAIQACTVCFGGSDTNLARGFYWGVLILGALPFALMALLVGAFIYHYRKVRKAAMPS